jgi:hypothetical protein
MPTNNCEDIDEANYEEWQETRIPQPHGPGPFQNVDCRPSFHLVDYFKEIGLHVIVKIATIELTPDKSEFPARAWHPSHWILPSSAPATNLSYLMAQVQGQLNEHIVGTALYHVDSDNKTSTSPSFRI